MLASIQASRRAMRSSSVAASPAIFLASEEISPSVLGEGGSEVALGVVRFSTPGQRRGAVDAAFHAIGVARADLAAVAWKQETPGRSIHYDGHPGHLPRRFDRRRAHQAELDHRVALV